MHRRPARPEVSGQWSRTPALGHEADISKRVSCSLVDNLETPNLHMLLLSEVWFANGSNTRTLELSSLAGSAGSVSRQARAGRASVNQLLQASGSRRGDVGRQATECRSEQRLAAKQAMPVRVDGRGGP